MVKLSKNQFIARAKIKYKTLQKAPVYSPALKDYVYFTKKGFGHLAHNGTRSFNDVYRRLKLLPYAKPILSTIKTFRTRVMADTTSFEICGHKAVKICGKSTVINVKVVVILTTQKKYTFLSIM